MYVDDFVYFSADPDVEKAFETQLSQQIKVDFMGTAEWFVGIKFDGSFSSDGKVDCPLSQEAYANIIVEAMGLGDASVSPLMTPFRSGYPIDAVPHQEMSTEA